MRRWVLLVMALAVVPLTALIVFNEFSVRRDRDQQMRERALLEASNAAADMARFFQGTRMLLDAVATSPSVRDQDWTACRKHLARLAARHEQFLSLAVLGHDGDVRCRQDDVSGRNFRDRGYFQSAVAAPGKTIISEMVVSRISDRPVLPIALGYTDEGGALLGVVVASLDLQWLGIEIGKRALPAGSSLTLADRAGTIVARRPLAEQFLGTKIPEQFTRLLTAEEKGVEEVLSLDGTRRFLGYVPLTEEPVGLYVSAGLPVAAAFTDLDEATIRG